MNTHNSLCTTIEKSYRTNSPYSNTHGLSSNPGNSIYITCMNLPQAGCLEWRQFTVLSTKQLLRQIGILLTYMQKLQDHVPVSIPFSTTGRRVTDFNHFTSFHVNVGSDCEQAYEQADSVLHFPPLVLLHFGLSKLAILQKCPVYLNVS